jgi:Fe-S-cluster containining protein
MDLKNFKRRAARHKEGLISFLQRLDKIVPEDMPQLVAETDAEVWSQIDCTTCAHCCKTMTPTFSQKDIKRISAHLGMKPREFTDKWLHQDEENGDWVNNQQPCQFLQPDNRCGIYEVRPLDCAEFPHHNKKPFDDYNETFIGNLHRCPATFELVSRLKKKVENDYEW